MTTYKPSRLFFDIETLSSPEACALMPEPKPPSNYSDPVKIAKWIDEAKAEAIEKAALDPDYGKVLSIGISYGEFISAWIVGEPFGPQPEPEPVFDNSGEITDGTITYNLPPPNLLTEHDMISMFWDHFAECRGNCVGFNILSFDLPYLMARSMYLGVRVPFIPMLAKFRTEPVTDLYAIRYNWGPGKGLKQVCKLLGIVNDCPDVDGSKVKDLKPDELRAYQISDVRLVMELYRRMNGVYFCH
jgi:hypothetical protein